MVSVDFSDDFGNKMKLYLFVNPYSGGGKGQAAHEAVMPPFDKAGMDLEVIQTTHSGHPKELTNTLDLNGFDGLCAIGGDGTLGEVVNGLLSREDGEQIPLGFIPGGSGNSYIRDMDMLDPVKAVENIIHGTPRKMDVVKLTFQNDLSPMYVFNIIGWGMVTDIGIQAENIRWLGESRYTLMSVVEVMKNRSYKARLLLDDKDISDEFSFVIFCNTIHTGKGMKMAPLAKLDDGLVDVVVVRHVWKRREILTMMPKIFNGSHTQHPAVEYFQVKKFSLAPEKDDILNINGEIIGSTPVKGKVIPGAFSLLMRSNNPDQ